MFFPEGLAPGKEPEDAPWLVPLMKYGRLIPVAITLALGLVCALGAPSAPVDLLVNGTTEPLAVERDAIGFTWRLQETTRGAAQTAYQILVSSSRESLRTGNGDCWDSGRVASDQSIQIPYGGRALKSGTACFCMLAPIRARFASSCSRNGMSAAAIETSCLGETSTDIPQA